MLTRQRRPQLNSRSSRRFNTLDGMPLIDHPMPMTMEDHPMPVYDHPPMPMPPIYEDKNGGGFQPVPIMPPIIAPPPHKLETDHPPQMILNDNPDSPFGNNNGVAGQEADNGEEMSGWQKALKVASGALKGLEDSADRQPVQPITPIVLPTIQTHPYFADPYRMQQPQALSQGGRMMPGMQYRIGAEKACPVSNVIYFLFPNVAGWLR